MGEIPAANLASFSMNHNALRGLIVVVVGNIQATKPFMKKTNR